MESIYTEFTDASQMSISDPAWWQQLIGLGATALDRALPLPGYYAGGAPGNPYGYAPPTANTSGIPSWVLLLGGAFIFMFALKAIKI